MRLAADPEAAEWLEEVPGGSRGFDWDEGNRGKLIKHRVEPEDVESIFRSPFVFAGRIIEPEHEEQRWLVLGRVGDRRLALIFTRRGKRLRPISCRSMRQNEKQVYEDAIEEEGKGESRDS